MVIIETIQNMVLFFQNMVLAPLIVNFLIERELEIFPEQ